MPHSLDRKTFHIYMSISNNFKSNTNVTFNLPHTYYPFIALYFMVIHSVSYLYAAYL